MSNAFKNISGANIIAVLVAHIPCCGPNLLLGIVGAHGFGAAASGFMHDMELFAPLIAASVVTGYMVFLLRSRQKKHACCAHDPAHAHQHSTHSGTLRDIAIFFLVNLLIGYALGFAVHELFHEHH